MILRLCDRCRIQLDDATTQGSYSATTTREDGTQVVVAKFDDVCADCLTELRAAHAEKARRRRSTRDKVQGSVGRRKSTRHEAEVLRGAIVQVIAEHDGRATKQQVLEGLQSRGISVPGKSAARTLSTYLSRHEDIEMVSPGEWRLKGQQQRQRVDLTVGLHSEGGGGDSMK